MKLWARWFYWQHHGNDLQPPPFLSIKAVKAQPYLFGNLIFAESSIFSPNNYVYIFLFFYLNKKTFIPSRSYCLRQIMYCLFISDVLSKQCTYHLKALKMKVGEALLWGPCPRPLAANNYLSGLSN